MSKRRPANPANPANQGVTAASSAVEIMRAKVAVQLELLRRQGYEDLLVLQAKLAKLPPVPEASDQPDNDT